MECLRGEHTDIREKTEEIENTYLSPFAARASATRGRAVYEEPCPIRTVYARDRDRIIHCKSFRRLKYKTQVFLAPEGDHYRTRLTHTLEVSQIARTIAKALRLNEDLTEAIALAHDLGHTPFGHAGERALDEVSACGFHHYTQSLRVVDRIEHAGRGLNLTDEVRNGIERHTNGTLPSTLEGCVVRLSDRIAYINHDIDDAIRAGVLRESDIPEKDILGQTHSKRINTLITDTIACSEGKVALAMSPAIAESFDRLHSFMFESVYTNPLAKSEEVKAKYIVKRLFEYFMRHTNKMHEDFRRLCAEDGANQAVCDYIAGMTDRYAIQIYSDIFIPKAWNK